MRGLWDEFEERKTPEAKFARTLDNIQPVMLNNASGGRSWEEKCVHLNQILKRNENTKDGSETLWDYALSLIHISHMPCLYRYARLSSSS